MIIDLDDGTSYNTHRDEITRSSECGPDTPDIVADLAGEIEDRTMTLHAVTQHQFYGLTAALRLPVGQFGRFKGYPGEGREITLDDDLCEGRLDEAIAYAQRLGIGYDLSTTVVSRSPARISDQQPPAWSLIHPKGCWIYYRGDSPAQFAEAIAKEFGFNPAASDDWTTAFGHGFQCPVEHIDAIYGSGRWPLTVP